jgi:hypothetical protein
MSAREVLVKKYVVQLKAVAGEKNGGRGTGSADIARILARCRRDQLGMGL